MGILSLWTRCSEASVEDTFSTAYLDARTTKFYFCKFFLAVPFPARLPKKSENVSVERLFQAMLAGLLLALTRQAASALLELSSPTLTSWRDFFQWPEWAPYWLGACTPAPWDRSRRRVMGPTLLQVALWGPWKEFSPSMIGVQQCAGLFLVVLGRLAHGHTKPANLLTEGSHKLLSLLAFLSWNCIFEPTLQLVGVLVEPL